MNEELSYLDLSLMSTREIRLVRRARQDRGEMVKGFQQGGLLVAVRAPGAYRCNTVGGHAMACVVVMIIGLITLFTITLLLSAAANLGRAPFRFCISVLSYMGVCIILSLKLN